MKLEPFFHLGYLLRGYLSHLGLTQGLKKEIGGAISQSLERNPWFTDAGVRQSLWAVARDMLAPKQMQEWISRYAIPPAKPAKNVGIIMAGNIPLVGFHDLLCVLASGNRAVVKLSGKDSVLLPTLVRLLAQIDYHFSSRVEFVEDVAGADAVIATGSDNAARYFESQHGAKPHIFRKNRTSVAMLYGGEAEEELRLLAHDALDYFGMGCRSVGKIFVPQGFDVSLLQNAFADFAPLREHGHYGDCLRYLQALHRMRAEEFYDLGGCLATHRADLHSPVGEVFLQEYSSAAALEVALMQQEKSIQCVAAQKPLAGMSRLCVPLGQTQRPRLWDYADGVDTMKFLLELV